MEAVLPPHVPDLFLSLGLKLQANTVFMLLFNFV